MNNRELDFCIFNTSPFIGLIIRKDSPKFTIEAVTNAYLNLFGKQKSEIVETGFYECFSFPSHFEEQEFFSTIQPLLLKVLKTGDPTTYSEFYYQIKEKDVAAKKEIYLDLEFTPVKDEKGIRDYIIVSFNDITNTKHSHSNHPENYEFYKNVVENSFSAFFLTKPDGTILEANQSACDLFGYSIEELRQIGRDGIIDPLQKLLIEKVKERDEKGKVIVELEGIKKNGQKFPIEVISKIFTDKNGKKRSSSIINDITDRKEIENALVKSEFYLKEAQKIAKMGSWNFDFKSDKLSWTDGLYKVFGVTNDTFLETHGSFTSLVVEEDREYVAQTSKQAQLTGEPFNIEYGIITPSGEKRIIEEFGYSEKNKDGEIIRLFGTAQDITQRKIEEETITASEKKYKMLFEDNPMPMLIWDFETLNIVDCNEETLIKYGYTRNEFLQLNIRDIRPKEDISLIEAATESEDAYGRIHKEAWRHIKKSGELMYMEVTGHLMDYNGRKSSLVLLNDVTEKVKAKTLLLESEKRYKSLFYNGPLPKWVYDVETLQIIDVNLAASTHYGYSRDEFLNMTLRDLRPKSELSKLTNAHKYGPIDGQVLKFGIFNHKKKNGELIKVEVSGHLTFYSEKKCMLVVCNDVTEREKTLQIFKENETKLLTAQRIAKLGYWQYDIKGKNIFWSDEVYTIWGVTKDSFHLSYDSFLNSIHPDDRIIFEKEGQNIFVENKETDFQHRILLPNGSVKWIQVKGTLFPAQQSLIYEGTVQDITIEKTLQLSLKESVDRYNYATKATSDAIWDWDIKGDLIHFGEGFHILFGYESNIFESAMDINSWSKYLHPDDLQRVMEGLDFVKNGTESNWSDEYRYLKRDGTYAFVIDRGFIIRDDRQNAIRMVGAMQDITLRKNEEQKKLVFAEVSRLFNLPYSLSESLHQVLRSIMQSGNYCLAEAWLIDSDKKSMNLISHTFVGDKLNNFYAETSGYRNITMGEGLQGRVWLNQSLQRWDIDGEHNYFTRKKEAIKAGLKAVIGIPLLHNESIVGSILLGSTNLQKVQREFIFKTNEFSKHFGAEVKRKQLEQELNQAFNYSNDIIWISDLQGNFKKINPIACKFLEYTEEELLNKPFRDFIHPDDLEMTLKRISTISKENPELYFENRYISKSGKIIWFAWSSNTSPEEKLIFSVGKNISDKKKLEEKLDQHTQKLAISNKELEQFAYVASHDLQEPLRMVTSFLNQLEKKYGNTFDERGKQYIYFAVDGAKRMRQIILDLLEFSRVGRFDNATEKINLNELIIDVTSLYKIQVEETNAKIVVGKLPSIVTYRTPLFQVFNNIIGNALKYRNQDQSPIIEIQCKIEANYLLFSVKDNGIGISKVYFEKIFTIFQRLHNKNEYSGTGIGLAIVKKIITSLNGEIWLESEEGKGSIFYFKLPKKI